MTTLSRTQVTSSSHGPVRRTLGFIAQAYGVWRSRRALAQLTAAQLEDVGITETQVAREVNRSVWDVPAHWTR